MVLQKDVKNKLGGVTVMEGATGNTGKQYSLRQHNNGKAIIRQTIARKPSNRYVYEMTSLSVRKIISIRVSCR